MRFYFTHTKKDCWFRLNDHLECVQITHPPDTNDGIIVIVVCEEIIDLMVTVVCEETIDSSVTLV